LADMAKLIVALHSFAELPKIISKCVLYPGVLYCKYTSDVRYTFRYELKHAFVILLYLPLTLHMTFRNDVVSQDQP
jgi:hypothetical protein